MYKSKRPCADRGLYPNVISMLCQLWRCWPSNETALGEFHLSPRLSKAFDCMPHGLLLAKLEAYGLSGNSIKIMRSYLTGRKQRVKIGNGISEWADILKGVPQGSILGPILFNIFLNDMFKFIRKAELVNHADDNTINAIESSQQLVVQTLQIESKAAINWFTLNEMLANPNFRQFFWHPQTWNLNSKLMTSH